MVDINVVAHSGMPVFLLYRSGPNERCASASVTADDAYGNIRFRKVDVGQHVGRRFGVDVLVKDAEPVQQAREIGEAMLKEDLNSIDSRGSSVDGLVKSWAEHC
jgi:hypothetical protein